MFNKASLKFCSNCYSKMANALTFISNQRLYVHVVRGFSLMDEMTKVWYFLMFQIHDLRTLRGWAWYWDLSKTKINPNFDPMDISRTGKLKMKLQKISYFRQFVHGRKSQDDMNKFYVPYYFRKKGICMIYYEVSVYLM